MKKELLFALIMSASLGIELEELADAQSAFVDDYKKEAKL